MAVSVMTINEHGDGHLVAVECHMSNSLPNIVIVGFASRSVYEARERIRGALSNSGLVLPPKRITLNLAPADIPKDGSAYDLPMLVAVMASAGMPASVPDKDTAVIGEVGLDGSIRAVRGIVGKILAAKKLGMARFIIPRGNLAQAGLIPGITIYAFDTVSELYASLSYGKLEPAEIPPVKPGSDKYPDERVTDMDDVSGQPVAKRALMIAAAGHHNVLLTGPPGTGKTMLARGLQGIMPGLLPGEILEVTHLHSLAGKNFERIITSRPFRAPHHSSSASALLGGGPVPRPGEVSLSHHGILFMDELPEFRRDIIEAMRLPLEDGRVSITRTGGSMEFPSHFLLVAASNPCPCGFFGSEKACACSLAAIRNYQKKISGPIIDRIDLHVDVEHVPASKLLTSHNIEESSLLSRTMATKIRAAREVQIERAGKLNSLLGNKQLLKTAKLPADARKLLDGAANRLQLSARAYVRTLRVARTIADLEESDSISSEHIAEALQFRRKPVA